MWFHLFSEIILPAAMALQQTTINLLQRRPNTEKKKREAAAWVTPTVFLRGFEITRTPDDVWKTSWQKCESVYRDSETWSSSLVSRLTWGKCGKQTLLMWFLLYVSESFHVGAIEPNSMAEWRTQVVWNVLRKHQLHCLMMHRLSVLEQTLDYFCPFLLV